MSLFGTGRCETKEYSEEFSSDSLIVDVTNISV